MYLPNTTEALALYDSTMPERQAMLDGVITNESFHAWERTENEATRRVQEAFFKDCCEHLHNDNSQADCYLVGIDVLRRWVAGLPTWEY